MNLLNKIFKIRDIEQRISELEKSALKYDSELRFNRGDDIDNAIMNLNIKLNSITAPKYFNAEELLNKKIRPLNMVFLDSNMCYSQI